MKPSRKILHIVDSLGLGGAQVLLKGFFESLQEDQDALLFSLRRRELQIEINYPKIVQFPSKEKFSFKPLRAIKKLIVENQIEVLHCHLFRSQFFGLLVKLFWFRRIKLIFHEHGRVLRGGFGNRAFLLTAKRFVDVFIAVSDAAKQALVDQARIDPSRIKVVPNFFDAAKFDRSLFSNEVSISLRDRFQIRPDEWIVGFVGRLDKVKGCEYLLRAIASLDKKVRVLVIGDGGLKTELMELTSSLNISDRALFVGFEANPAIFYTLFDILVVPSISESFGLSAIEGQAMGVPVIASEVGGLREVIQDGKTGLFFRTKDPSDLASKIMRLKEDIELMDRLRSNALESVKKFTLQQYTHLVDAIYQSL